jgi:hypothetical protein
MMTTQALKVENTAFLIEKLASECEPLQYVRELTVNSIEAISARREKGWTGEGEVCWDVDWTLVNDQGIFKLQISDNGTGMTGEEIERYINSLSSSSREQGFTANYGLGAKITAGVLNPSGLIYRSWKDGAGVMAVLHKDVDANVYGLQQLALPNGQYGHYAPLNDAAKASPIDESGTAVVLMGKSLEDNSFRPTNMPSKWLIKYLNSRFFEFPEGVKINVREFHRSDPNDWPTSPNISTGDAATGGSQNRRIKGMKRHLEEHAGVVLGKAELSNATIRWYLLPEEKIQQSDIWDTSAHVAALYQSELYETKSGRNAYGRLRDFGVIFGYDRVVLYVEPKRNMINVMSNTARSMLVVDGKPLPWDTWASEFRNNLPAEIKAMMDGIIDSSSGRDHRDSIRRRLRDMKALFSVTRYRRSASGNLNSVGSLPGGIERELGGTKSKESSRSNGGAGGGAGALYGAYLDAGGDQASAIATHTNFPEVRWVSVTDRTRVNDDELEDRAALYEANSNTISVNRDFRVFDDMVEEVGSRYAGAPASEVIDVVQEWFSQQLVEAVIGIQSLKGSPAWATDTIGSALSPEALTTAVMPRYNTMRQITRALGARLGANAATLE